MSMWPLLLLPLFLAATAVDEPPPPPPMTPWPEQYHAVVVTNLTASGGRLQLIDIYYDWPRRRNLNLFRDQLSGEPPLRTVQWANRTTFRFDAASCSTFQFDLVGLLPPDWKKAYGGAAYQGRRVVDGFDCHVWSNILFERYYEDAATGRPVAWNSMGKVRHVLSFEEGGVPEDSSVWQAPAYCFDGNSGHHAGDGGDSQGSSRDDEVNSLVSFAGTRASVAAASFGQ